MRARIYKPAKTAMSSGTAKTNQWVLEYCQASAREIDPGSGCVSKRNSPAIDMFSGRTPVAI